MADEKDGKKERILTLLKGNFPKDKEAEKQKTRLNFVIHGLEGKEIFRKNGISDWGLMEDGETMFYEVICGDSVLTNIIERNLNAFFHIEEVPVKERKSRKK